MVNLIMAFVLLFSIVPTSEHVSIVAQVRNPNNDTQLLQYDGPARIGDRYMYSIKTDWMLFEETDSLVIELDNRLKWESIGSGSSACYSGSSLNEQICPVNFNGHVGPKMVWIWVKVLPTNDPSPLTITATFKGDTIKQEIPITFSQYTINPMKNRANQPVKGRRIQPVRISK